MNINPLRLPLPRASTQFILLCLCFTVITYAQQRDTFSEEMHDAGKAGSALLNATFKPGVSTTTTALSVLLVTTGAHFADDQVRMFLKQNHNEVLDNLLSLDKYYGDAYTYIPILALYGYGISNNNPELRSLGLKLTAASTFAILYNISLKMLVGRSRPFTNRGKADFEPFSTSFEKTSFPSGHTTFTFAIAAVIANQYDSPFVRTLGYSAAALTAIARMYHDVHWFSDTILGAAIGYYTGKFVSEELDRLEKKNSAQPIAPQTIFYLSIPL